MTETEEKYLVTLEAISLYNFKFPPLGFNLDFFKENSIEWKKKILMNCSLREFNDNSKDI